MKDIKARFSVDVECEHCHHVNHVDFKKDPVYLESWGPEFSFEWSIIHHGADVEIPCENCGQLFCIEITADEVDDKVTLNEIKYEFAIPKGETKVRVN